MTASRRVLFAARWCDADWGLWLGKRDDRDLVSDDAERGTGGAGLGERLRCGRLCGCQWAGLLGRFDTDADSEPRCQRASIRDPFGAREHITADPSATTSGALGAVTMQVTRTTVPAEFRYVVLGGGEEFRLVVLDLNAGRAAQVATARIAMPSGAPTGPSAAVAASKDGLIVLVTFVVPDASDSLFVVRPEIGDAKLLLRGEIRGAVGAPEGARIAIGRNDEDPSLTGLWVGTPDGAMRRLVADDASSTGSPPLPYAFSPDNALLAFGIGLGESGWQATVISASSKEGRIDREGGGTEE